MPNTHFTVHGVHKTQVKLTLKMTNVWLIPPHNSPLMTMKERQNMATKKVTERFVWIATKVTCTLPAVVRVRMFGCCQHWLCGKH